MARPPFDPALNPKDATDASDPKDAPRVTKRYPLEFGFHLTSAPPLPVIVSSPAPATIVSAVEDALAPFGAHIQHHPISPMDIIAIVEAGRKA